MVIPYRSVLPFLSLASTASLFASPALAQQPQGSTVEKLDKIAEDFRSILSNQVDNIWLNTVMIGLALISFYLLMRWLSRVGEYRDQERWDSLQKAQNLRVPGLNWQRRAMVRVPWDGILLYAQTNEWTGLDCAKINHEKIYEASGCGLSFITEAPPALGSRLMILLDLGLETPLHLKGRVVRVDSPPASLGPGKWVGVEFVGIQLCDQDKIVRWTSELLRRLLVEHRRLEEGACVRCGGILKPDTLGAMCQACAAAAQDDPASDWYRAYLRPSSPALYSHDRRSVPSSQPGEELQKPAMRH